MTVTADITPPRSEVAVLLRLRAALPLLGPSERRVVQSILEQPGSVVEWSTAELAAAAGTSTATVVRASQNLGFRGFQHLRLEVARSGQRDSGSVLDAHPLATIFDDAANAIKLGSLSVDLARFDAAVEVLAVARRLVLVGSGFSAPPLQDAAMRFSTLGRSVEAPADILGQQFAARSLTTVDACLSVSYSGANAHSLRACRAAQEGGATLIAVTSFGRSPLTRLADISLVTGPITRTHDVDPFLSRLSHLLILHGLHAALHGRISVAATAPMREVVADALVFDE